MILEQSRFPPKEAGFFFLKMKLDESLSILLLWIIWKITVYVIVLYKRSMKSLTCSEIGQCN